MAEAIKLQKGQLGVGGFTLMGRAGLVTTNPPHQKNFFYEIILLISLYNGGLDMLPCWTKGEVVMSSASSQIPHL